MIASEQVKAARGLIGWSQSDLADNSKLSIQTIKRMESIPGELRGQPDNVEKVFKTFKTAGIIFIPADAVGGPGVRLKK